ncbi:Uncharacterised protein [Mycobacteroides abscessus subsp. abscessus]|nr:Uncharacterised protein [Mycobacteroides abscessus subsp. abscessus]
MLPRRQCDGENLGLEAGALTYGARDVPHEALVALLGPFRLGLFHAALQEGKHAFEFRVVRTSAPVPVLVPHVDLLGGAVQNCLLGGRGQFLPRGIHIESESITESGHEPDEVVGVLPHRPGCDRALGQCHVRVRDHQVGIDLLLDPQAGAFGTCTIGRVERKRPRFKIIHSERVAVGAGEFLGEPALSLGRIFIRIHELEYHDTVGEV